MVCGPAVRQSASRLPQAAKQDTSSSVGCYPCADRCLVSTLFLTLQPAAPTGALMTCCASAWSYQARCNGPSWVAREASIDGLHWKHPVAVAVAIAAGSDSPACRAHAASRHLLVPSTHQPRPTTPITHHRQAQAGAAAARCRAAGQLCGASGTRHCGGRTGSQRRLIEWRVWWRMRRLTHDGAWSPGLALAAASAPTAAPGGCPGNPLYRVRACTAVPPLLSLTFSVCLQCNSLDRSC